MPYAKRRINMPGTLAAGYQPGNFVPDSVVANWALVEGEDYSATPLGEEVEPAAVPRPADDSDRGAWVAYAVARGMDPDEANRTDLDALIEAYPDEVIGEQPERPADSAKKADWVEWAIEAGADEGWARDDSTTKAQLQDYTPGTKMRQASNDPAADQGNATVGA